MEVRTDYPAASRQPDDRTTGVVWSETLAEYGDPITAISRAHFEPGARTCWHLHRFGQVLVVESGVAVVQEEGGAPQVLGPGATVVCPPGTRHWHGAARGTTMTQLAVTPADEHGEHAVWERHVTDEEYLAVDGTAR